MKFETTCIALSALFICLFFAFFITPSSLLAKEDASWTKDKALVESLDIESRCEERWDILWSWAKKENLEARFILFFLLVPPPDMDEMYMPGNKGDLITNLRDITIMAVHSIDYRGNFPDRNMYFETAKGIFSMAGFDKSKGGKKFMKCIEDIKSNNCSFLAVEEKLVPSFKDFALQIDAFVKQGMKNTCSTNSK